VIYIVFAMLLSKVCDNFLGKFDKEKEDTKSIERVILELLGIFWAYGIIIYIVRNIVKQIPFPLDTVGGFHHENLKELKGAGMFTVVFFYFQNNIKAKMQYVFDKIKL
jgi:hypothetical protein